ncbi:MAG TPA: transcriptional repressor [Clostridiaceae bacterium]|nr:transcriptional repressor [Clostridiaceae bacterium]
MANKLCDENILAKKGCKNTKSRKAVLDIMEKADTALSAEDIFIRVKESGNSVNLSTVYRTLELMEKIGLAEKTVMSDGKARYTLSGDGHKHHIICTSCHKTVEINSCPLGTLEKDVMKETSFDITGHKLEIYGLCPECKIID